MDIILLKRDAFAESEFSRRQAVELLGTSVFVASAEDTILSKLTWAHESGSDLQLRDAAGVVASCGDVLDRDYVERWADELGLGDLWRRVSEPS